MNLPETFEKKVRELLGDEFDAYLSCYEAPRYYGLRVNTQKIGVAEFERICPFEITPIPWIENGFYYDGEQVSPSKHPFYHAGLYYLQEPSAMTPANRLPIAPGDKVLDLCAAPGGKATALGAALARSGLLVANDISSSRAKGLLKNIEVFGIGNALVLSEEPAKLAEYFPEYFDKILIDAPCSGEGMFRKDKKMIKAWEEHGPEHFVPLQEEILMQAAKMLKPGGLLLYSTCTFDETENEGTIAKLLAAKPEFTMSEMTGYEGFMPGISKGHSFYDFSSAVRIWPHKMKGEGHFLILLQKAAADLPTLAVKKHRAEVLPLELQEFLSQVQYDFNPAQIVIQKERVYYLPPELPSLKGIRFLRTGLLLGELKKHRFEPSQALAMYLTKAEYRDPIDLKLDDPRVIKYLKGETIPLEAEETQTKGWKLICVSGYPLGWGKVVNGMIRNKYATGWRWQSI